MSGNQLKKEVEALKPDQKLEEDLNKIKVDLFENLNNVPNVPHGLVQKVKMKKIMRLSINQMILTNYHPKQSHIGN